MVSNSNNWTVYFGNIGYKQDLELHVHAHANGSERCGRAS